MKIWLLPLFLSVAAALPTTDNNELTEDEQPSCDEVFSNNGMNFSSFYKGAAHGIHSLSLEEIRHFFKEDAPDENGIPTVNIDLDSNNVFHFNAPLWGYEDRFGTWALKIMDWFMLNDRKHFYQSNANTLEKITHQYHMQEIYQKASVIYKDLVTNPPKDVEGFCSCATDLTWNGVLKEVVKIARELRHFAQVKRNGRTGRGCNIYLSYGCTPKIQREKRSTDEDAENIEKKLIEAFLNNSTQETAKGVVMSSVAWKPGTFVGPEFGKEKWVPYSAMLVYSLPEDDGIKDFAHFIYCMLNHPANKKTTK